MGAIPLPQLDIHAPVIPNAQDQQMKSLQLQALTQQMQTESMRQEQLAQENDLRQQQISDTVTARRMASDPKYLTKDPSGNVTGYDYDKLNADLGAAGVGPATLAQFQTLRKNSADAFLLHQQGVEAATKNQQNLLTSAYGKLEDYKGLTDPNDRATAWNSLLTWGKQNGADVSSLPSQPPTNDQIAPLEATLGMHQQATVDAKNRADAQKAAADAFLEQNKADMVAAYKKDPQSLLAQVDAVAPASTYGPLNSRTKFQVNQALQMGDVDGAKAALKAAGEQVGAIEKETNPSVVATKEKLATDIAQNKMNIQTGGYANPDNPVIDLVGQHSVDLATALSRTPPAVRALFFKNLTAKYPEFDQAGYSLEKAAAQKASSGAWADSRLAYQTAIDHSKQLLAAMDGLDNGDVQKLNDLKNFFKTQFGYSGPMTYDAISNAYNHEVASVVGKGHITDAEVATGHAVLPTGASKQQTRDVVNAYQGLMNSKQEELDKIIALSGGRKVSNILNADKPAPAAPGATPGAFNWNNYPKSQ